MRVRPISTLKIMIALFLLFLSACAGAEQKAEDSAVQKIRGIYERLVQSGLSKYPPIWCGPDTIVYRTKKFSKEGQGTFHYDLITGKKLKLGGRDYFPAACTPDGKWIIYAHKTSYNWAESDIYQNGETKELWRYEFATKRRERFLIVNNLEFPITVEQQGEGYRIHSGKKPQMQIEMKEPKWEVIRPIGKRKYNSFFSDDYSSAAGFYWDYNKNRLLLEIELFRPVRKIINLYQPYKSFSFLFSDSKDRIYIKIHGDKGDKSSRGDIVRCDIDVTKESMSCTTVLDLTRTSKPLDSECSECPAKQYKPNVTGIDIFKDAETIAYMQYADSCAFIKRIGDKEPKCLTETTHYSGGKVFISPDERWIAITPFRMIGEDDESGSDIADIDLYVIEIRKE